MSFEVNPLFAEGRKMITSYGDGLFRFGEEAVTGSIILSPTAVFSWGVSNVDDIEAGSFDQVATQLRDIDILLLGMGTKMQPVPMEWRAALKKQGIVLEPMDTGAACRTYNVLVSEERRVAAALIAV
ncbi:Mth938-like domain-containing protein [Thalassospira sp. MA62]|nr:Mth938-like domain-containing protein [Thalassospira sp. MA62]